MYEMLERLFSGTFGGTIIMVLVSAAVVFFLRALYGPKGIYRDPKWDESNRRIRQQEAERRERLLKRYQEEEGVSSPSKEQSDNAD
ncbi:MAG: hypothetical protein IJY48_04895 [Mailhella sp.]|nr:hypothetical protein [Mailhella sp.]